jgi:hypothetical protein
MRTTFNEMNQTSETNAPVVIAPDCLLSVGLSSGVRETTLRSSSFVAENAADCPAILAGSCPPVSLTMPATLLLPSPGRQHPVLASQCPSHSAPPPASKTTRPPAARQRYSRSRHVTQRPTVTANGLHQLRLKRRFHFDPSVHFRPQADSGRLDHGRDAPVVRRSAVVSTNGETQRAPCCAALAPTCK